LNINTLCRCKGIRKPHIFSPNVGFVFELPAVHQVCSTSIVVLASLRRRGE